jgi:non-specific serine/threonine protein kinase
VRIAGHLLRHDAVRLFVDRAAAARISFTFDDASATAIGEICRRLDGIPLAIELAAARVTVLTVEQIAARLSDRFRLLVSGNHSTPPRHQTLRSVMDWSYELLPSSERLLLQRVSVFAGGWTINAAEATCTGDQIAASNILDLLQQLASKSLIVVHHHESAEARYWLLETVRQYASEKLGQSGEATAVRRQHHEWFMRLAEKAEPDLRGPRQVTALGRLDAELDNLRAGMEWCLGADGNPVSGLRTAVAMGLFWVVRAQLREGQQWVETLLRSASGAPPLLRAKALAWIGVLAWWLGDVAAIRGPSEEALTLGRAHGYRWESALALHQLAHVVATEGDPTLATRMMEESVALFRDDGDQWGIAYSLGCLGDLARIQGQLDQARRLLDETVAIMRRIKNTWGLGNALHNLGHVLLRTGSPEHAEVLFAESLVYFRAVRGVHGMLFCLAGLAGAAARRGQLQRAARMFGAADALLQAAELSWQPVDRVEYDRNLTIVREGTTQTVFNEAWSAGRSMTLDEAIDYALDPLDAAPVR